MFGEDVGEDGRDGNGSSAGLRLGWPVFEVSSDFGGGALDAEGSA